MSQEFGSQHGDSPKIVLLNELADLEVVLRVHLHIDAVVLGLQFLDRICLQHPAPRRFGSFSAHMTWQDIA